MFVAISYNSRNNKYRNKDKTPNCVLFFLLLPYYETPARDMALSRGKAMTCDNLQEACDSGLEGGGQEHTTPYIFIGKSDICKVV